LFASDPRAFRDWFDSGSAEYNAARRLLEDAAREESERRAQLQPLSEAVRSTREALAFRRDGRDEADREYREKKTARTRLLGGRPVVEVEVEIATALEAATKREKKAGAELAEGEKNFNHQSGLLKELQTQLAALQRAASEAKASVDRWLAEFAARESCELNRAWLDEWLSRGLEWINQEARELAEAEHKLTAARGTEATVRRQLEDHLQKKTTPDDHATVKADAERLTGESNTAKEATNAKRAVVLNDDERQRQAGELARTLEAQQKQADPWGKLNALIGSADGTRFRNIAQQWTLEILLRHANAQLSLLSGRYRLERLRDSLNLLVTDLEMDGQQRSVHSLSGGESFLVSLGLALGLASLTSSRLLIESLFIDEGFGSLDSETLRVALNALNHLEAQGRKVGVISHVSEMVDAIPVQVRVVRGAGGSSKVLI
jgi:exonuclease SbcC